ncbi:urease accessory protein UreE [Novosphingobium sp. SG916]|nr:urease accessory protein UreE [Novosphingobium sp. SG919]NMN89958.1 urease accessory protein UreE [Novosphingobium sp. SG916]
MADPDASRIILTHTNVEVRELNEAARTRMRAAQLLGEDVGLEVERGQRSFASGDRVMFLKNERSLEVKNGTLGTVEQVSEIAMRVRTDDGRSIAFDLKDYAHIDHGYAATIHKAQGMTVDTVHVLATPGLDRHAAYVALSRHRDQVDLHYGKDDFADRDRLVRALSRERGKDMASDYARVPEPVPEVQPRRGIFDGLKLKVPNFSAVPERVNFDGHRLKISKDLLQPVAPSPEIASIAAAPETREVQLRRERMEALTRHAKAIDGIYDTRAHGGRESPEQLAELKSARKAFEELRPHGPRDAEAAYARDPSLASEAARGNANRAIRALQLETELRTNPELRADRFVSRWNELSNQADRHYAAGDIDAHKSARTAMANMAKSLERDPQLESLLASRKAQLGITMMDSQRKLGPQLAFEHGLDLGRGRGLGL